MGIPIRMHRLSFELHLRSTSLSRRMRFCDHASAHRELPKNPYRASTKRPESWKMTDRLRYHKELRFTFVRTNLSPTILQCFEPCIEAKQAYTLSIYPLLRQIVERHRLLYANSAERWQANWFAGTGPFKRLSAIKVCDSATVSTRSKGSSLLLDH